MARSRVKGLNQTLRMIQQRRDAIVEGVTQGVEDVALDLLGQSAADAPVDTGDLRGSGSLEMGDKQLAKGTGEGGVMPVAKRDKRTPPRASVSFNMPYAETQHDDRTLRHPRGGKAGYLGDNLTQNTQKYIRHIKKKALGGHPDAPIQ